MVMPAILSIPLQTQIRTIRDRDAEPKERLFSHTSPCVSFFLSKRFSLGPGENRVTRSAV